MTLEMPRLQISLISKTIILKIPGMTGSYCRNSVIAGNQIIKDDSGLSSNNKKITADMIASAIPAAPNVFKGRQELVEQGVAILCQQALRFLAILGAGGMGKTSLALYIMDSDSVKNKFGERCYFILCELFDDAESLVQGSIHVMELTMEDNKRSYSTISNLLMVIF
ncbi:hypothetical protein K435DRAFT_802283 [Dendrothele bispora CBS 962.96]|uniref:NB-ARC domain-containing protein n=1 Tax=Dendrothele bispora (strain CBS 962.96) TaxID=1314807 RepID=A0A4S8LMX4_DENBC|nr:hypothetical protein K435DRAFT_802283 [Dendrothele bispora CBS 962.96]